MPKLKDDQVPFYRLHKQSGQAVARRLAGRGGRRRRRGAGLPRGGARRAAEHRRGRARPRAPARAQRLSLGLGLGL